MPTVKNNHMVTTSELFVSLVSEWALAVCGELPTTENEAGGRVEEFLSENPTFGRRWVTLLFLRAELKLGAQSVSSFTWQVTRIVGKGRLQ